MADVFIPETSDDHLTPYPRAPPPSPEMQPRSRNHQLFEIPASKFEGIGLDLRRDTFPLDDEEESPLAGFHVHSSFSPKQRTSPSSPTALDDDSLLGSPHKRVCCSLNTLPSGHVTTAFPSSNSHVSSGFGSYQSFLSGSIPMEGTNDTLGFTDQSASHSQSPYFNSRPHQNSSSLLVPNKDNSLADGETSDSATPTLFPPTSPSHFLSRSYDLHSIHPHLPHSYETTQLPEVRPTRSRTFGSHSPSHEVTRPRSQTLDTFYGEDPNLRKRKVSIKRKNPDENDSDASLQFCFDYSYSSTGSSGESDWVVVDQSVESNWPIEKKACCADDPSAVAISSQQEFGTSLSSVSPSKQKGSFSTLAAGRWEDGSLFMPSLQKTLLYPESMQQAQPSNTGMSALNNISPLHFTGSEEMGVAGVRMDTPTTQQGNLPSMESMECEGRLDSLECMMDCEQLPSNTSITSNMPHLATQVNSGPIMRLHPGAPPTQPNPQQLTLRHSCVEEYLQAAHNLPQESVLGGFSGDQFKLEVDLDSRLNLSKSL